MAIFVLATTALEQHRKFILPAATWHCPASSNMRPRKCRFTLSVWSKLQPHARIESHLTTEFSIDHFVCTVSTHRLIVIVETNRDQHFIVRLHRWPLKAVVAKIGPMQTGALCSQGPNSTVLPLGSDINGHARLLPRQFAASSQSAAFRPFRVQEPKV